MVLGAKKYPDAQLIVDGKKHWVVAATESVEPTHFAFEEVKDQIEAMVRSQKFQEAVAKRMDELKVEFPIELNEALFADAQAQEAQAPAQGAVAA